MNEFPEHDKKYKKEKSIYQLNLDTPRIIIITSIFVGLIILAVLTGMNLSNQSDSDFIAQDNKLLDSLISDNNSKGEINNNIVESPLEQGIVFNNIDGNKNSGSVNGLKKQQNNQLKNNKLFEDPLFEKSGIAPSSNSITTPSDILTHENIESIIPPVKKEAKYKPKKKKRKITRKPKKNKKKKKEKVVEVASISKKYSAPKTNKNYFAIQVASYDKRSRALSQVNKLEKMNYNAFITKGKVSGKNYYRVRVGPIFSRKKASDLLNEIQYDEQYEESYLIRE